MSFSSRIRDQVFSHSGIRRPVSSGRLSIATNSLVFERLVWIDWGQLVLSQSWKGNDAILSLRSVNVTMYFLAIRSERHMHSSTGTIPSNRSCRKSGGNPFARWKKASLLKEVFFQNINTWGISCLKDRNSFIKQLWCSQSKIPTSDIMLLNFYTVSQTNSAKFLNIKTLLVSSECAPKLSADTNRAVPLT